MRTGILYLTIVVIGFGVLSCEYNSSSSNNGTVSDLCEGTGGTLQNGDCVCQGEVCQDAKWCDSNGKCSTNTEITPDMLCLLSGGQPINDKCVCDSVECEEGVLCNLVTKKCPQSQPAQVTFADLCVYSGGTMSGDKCKCGEETCETNKICNGAGSCSKDVTVEPTTSCSNDNDGIGWLNQCTESGCQQTKCEIDVDGAKKPVSCNGNQCGSCLEYVSSCENDEEGNGIVSMCRGGEKIQLFACADGNSCLKKDCAETGCANEVLCGECHDGKFVCENGNVPENTKLLTYDGFYMDVPVGTITGMRSKCIDGKWTQLDLDDPENCYFGYLNSNQNSADFAKYPQITVNGKQIVTVWNYSYNGMVSNQYSLAACAEDGVNCGECSYSFSYCSGQQWYSCYNGQVLEQQCMNNENGNVMCHSSNSCYKTTTDAYCHGTVCQNCKSICDW